VRATYLSVSRDKLLHRRISSHRERVRERRGVIRIHRVRNAVSVLRNPLRIIMNRMIIEQDLISVSVIVHGDGGVRAREFIIESFSLFGSPIALRSFGVEHDRVLRATDGDDEKAVAGI